MMIVPKRQGASTLLRERKEFTDGRKGSIAEMTPEDRRVKIVLLGFPVGYELDVLPSHPLVVEDSFCRLGRLRLRRFY